MIDDDYGVTEEEKRPVLLVAKRTKNTIISNAEKGGWLQKESKKTSGKWSYRYFALIHDKLYYYKQPNDKNPRGLIDFGQVSVSIDLIPEEMPNLLLISPGNSKSILVKARDSSELEDWASVLELSSLKHKSAPSSQKVTKGMNWTNSKIFLNDFLSLADTGDLLLFQSSNNYNRVSLTISYPDGDVALLQADSIDGVSIVNAEEYLPQFKNQGCVLTLRQLKVQKNNEMLIKFEEFIKNFEKRKFSVSPISLLRSNNADGGANEVTACSAELVASAYKAMGLLSSSIAANKYAAANFSESKKLSLIGAKLGPEIQIEFGIY